MNKDLKNKLFKDKFPGFIYIDTIQTQVSCSRDYEFQI